MQHSPLDDGLRRCGLVGALCTRRPVSVPSGRVHRLRVRDADGTEHALLVDPDVGPLPGLSTGASYRFGALCVVPRGGATRCTAGESTAPGPSPGPAADSRVALDAAAEAIDLGGAVAVVDALTRVRRRTLTDRRPAALAGPSSTLPTDTDGDAESPVIGRADPVRTAVLAGRTPPPAAVGSRPLADCVTGSFPEPQSGPGPDRQAGDDQERRGQVTMGSPAGSASDRPSTAGGRPSTTSGGLTAAGGPPSTAAAGDQLLGGLAVGRDRHPVTDECATYLAVAFGGRRRRYDLQVTVAAGGCRPVAVAGHASTDLDRGRLLDTPAVPPAAGGEPVRPDGPVVLLALEDPGPSATVTLRGCWVDGAGRERDGVMRLSLGDAGRAGPTLRRATGVAWARAALDRWAGDVHERIAAGTAPAGWHWPRDGAESAAADAVPLVVPPAHARRFATLERGVADRWGNREPPAAVDVLDVLAWDRPVETDGGDRRGG